MSSLNSVNSLNSLNSLNSPNPPNSPNSPNSLKPFNSLNSLNSQNSLKPGASVVSRYYGFEGQNAEGWRCLAPPQYLDTVGFDCQNVQCWRCLERSRSSTKTMRIHHACKWPPWDLQVTAMAVTCNMWRLWGGPCDEVWAMLCLGEPGFKLTSLTMPRLSVWAEGWCWN